MVPVVTLAPNITNISCWKIAPKSLVYIDPRIQETFGLGIFAPTADRVVS